MIAQLQTAVDTEEVTVVAPQVDPMAVVVEGESALRPVRPAGSALPVCPTLWQSFPRSNENFEGPLLMCIP
jgi:hypothetical protein